MDSYKIKDFSKILKKNAQSQRHENLPKGTDAMRIYDRNLEEFPVTVDLYSDWAKVVDYGQEPLSDEDRTTCLDIINRFAYVDSNKIVYSYRAKLDKNRQHEKQEAEPCIVNVKENGFVFKTNLSSYADTGLFLDYARGREFIKDNCEEKDVLNLFSYTGSFSVYAAGGLAKTVTSVDMSQTYTKWAQENLAANGYEGENYQCVCSDAKKFVEQQMKNKSRYDIIIFDPPSFSNSHKMDHDFDVQRDFVFWIKGLASLLRKDGFILFSTNLSSFKMDRRRLKGLRVREMTEILRTEGFVKGRKGTVRSWVMTVEDNSLTLDWSEDRKPSYEKKERRDYKEDRPRRNYNDKSARRYHDDERPRRRFDSEDRPARRFHDDERPRRRFDSEDRPARRFHDDERPRRRFDSEDKKPRYSDRTEYKRPERSSSKRERPYGYDSFKPARNRNDSSDFFWNPEDIKLKK